MSRKKSVLCTQGVLYLQISNINPKELNLKRTAPKIKYQLFKYQRYSIVKVSKFQMHFVFEIYGCQIHGDNGKSKW